MMAKVLMIDDDEDMCAEMVDILRDEGIEITAVCAPAQGMQLLRENKYDLLLLDLVMPGINGYVILKNAKEIDPRIKVIVMTGTPFMKISGGGIAGRGADKSSLLELADGVIDKSVDVRSIIAMIKRLT